MLYLVECDFIDPALEAEWNAFYSGDKLRALLSVSGFLSSQRFSCIHGDSPKYLAVHSIVHEHVLAGDEYQQKGGGSFGTWQPHIGNWKRSIYRGMARAPAVSSSQALILGRSMPIENSRNEYALLESLAADAPGNSPSRRWLMVKDSVRADDFKLFEDVSIYLPITACLTADNIARG